MTLLDRIYSIIINITHFFTTKFKLCNVLLATKSDFPLSHKKKQNNSYSVSIINCMYPFLNNKMVTITINNVASSIRLKKTINSWHLGGCLKSYIIKIKSYEINGTSIIVILYFKSIIFKCCVSDILLFT